MQNYGPFTWSKEEDPAYSAYAKQYRREGQRATADAMAQAAALTGGQVSTAAATAASQAGDYYAGQLADVIPQLYENAYQRYLSDYSLLADQLGQVRQAEQLDYAKYLDELGQYNADRNLSYDQWLQGYNMLSGNLSAFQGQDQTEYGRLLDQIEYNMQQDALEREAAADRQNLYQAQVDAILSAGGTPSDALVGPSGYSDEYVNALRAYYAAQAAPSGGGGYDNYYEYEEEEDTQPPVTSEEGLSPAARAILESYRHVNPGTTSDVRKVFADRIETALNEGTITESDAEYLLPLFGY